MRASTRIAHALVALLPLGYTLATAAPPVIAPPVGAWKLEAMDAESCRLRQARIEEQAIQLGRQPFELACMRELRDKQRAEAAARAADMKPFTVTSNGQTITCLPLGRSGASTSWSCTSPGQYGAKTCTITGDQVDCH